MLTVLFVLALVAFICTIAHALNYCPVFVPVLLLCIIELLRTMPLK